MTQPHREFSEAFDDYHVVHAGFLYPERKHWFHRELSQVGVHKYQIIESQPTASDDLRLDRFAATHTNSGAILSVTDAIRRSMTKAYDDGLESVCLFEDDIVFRDSFRTGWSEVQREVEQIDWDVLFFYRWHFVPIVESSSPVRLVPIEETFCTHAMAVRRRAFQGVQAALDHAVAAGTAHDTPPFFQCLRSRGYKTFATTQNLVGQGAGLTSGLSQVVRGTNKTDVFRVRHPLDFRWHARDGLFRLRRLKNQVLGRTRALVSSRDASERPG